MSPERHPKRARKKAAAAARRQAQLAAARRRRRRRLIFLAALTAVVVLGGIGFGFFGDRDDETPAADLEATPGPDDATPPPDAEADDDRPIACGAERPAAADEAKPSFDEPEDQDLSPDNTYLLRLETSCGTIDIELAVATSPETTNSVAFLARQRFYDGLTFHRIVPGFVLQGGDPVGDGTGGSGYRVEEAPPHDLTYERGVVAMAKAGPEPSGTSGSQFFIVSGDEAGDLAPDFAYLGNVVAGMDAVDEIEAIGTGEGVPPEIVYIEQATIVEP